jgi:predicted RNase H-like HicB family nuclease
MLNDYLQSAIKQAKYEILDDDGSIYDEIPACKGVYTKANTFEECRSNLIEVLEEWIFIRLKQNLYIPPLENIDLNILETIDATY